MPKIFRSYAIIPRESKADPDAPEWLFLHQSQAERQTSDETRNKVLQLVGGERLEGESFREAILREASWQLDLDRDRDLLVAHMARINLEFVSSDYPTDVLGLGTDELDSRQPVHFAASFYLTFLYRAKAQAAVDSLDCVDWLNGDEVKRGVSDRGYQIDPLDHWLLQRADVIPIAGKVQ